MKVSTKGRYATRILLCIARLGGRERPIPKRRISAEEGISPDYIEQIMVPLKEAGLVTSSRGSYGGFRLAKDPAAITIYDILAATDGGVELVGCLSGGCERASSCVMRHVWQGAADLLRNYFSRITLQKLCEEYAARNAEQLTMFDLD